MENELAMNTMFSKNYINYRDDTVFIKIDYRDIYTLTLISVFYLFNTRNIRLCYLYAQGVHFKTRF